MKAKILGFFFSILLLTSAKGQTIDGVLYTNFNNYYKWRGGAFDSTLLLPTIAASIGRRPGAIRYSTTDSSLYSWTGWQWKKIGDAAVPTLQQVTTTGNTTTDTVSIIANDNSRVAQMYRSAIGPPGAFSGRLRISNNLTSTNITIFSDGISFNTTLNFTNGLNTLPLTNFRTSNLPDSSGILTQRVAINGTTYNTATNGVVNLGTDYIKTGDDASLRSLTITGTNGNGHIHLRHQASLPNATGNSTVIYANNDGDFAYKNDGDYHTTFATSANTANRTYTFQNKSYTVADNADVVKYTDTSALLLKTQLKRDTMPLAVFNVGSAAAGDTTAFTTSTLAGSFYLDGTDTMFITSYRVALQGTSASVTPDVWFNDSLNVTAGGTKLVNSPSAITNLTTGTSVSPNTNKIPPGNFVFVRFSAVTTKPTYFTLTLFGYRIRKQ